jgi:hypothetical protein
MHVKDKKPFKPFSMVVTTSRGYISYENGKQKFISVSSNSNLPLYFLIKFADFEMFKPVPEGTGSIRSKLAKILMSMEKNG